MKAKAKATVMKKSIIVVLAAILMVLGMAQIANAAGFPVPPLTGEEGSISITYSYMSTDSGKVLIEGAKFAVYKVADFTVNGDNQAEYTAVAPFDAANVDYESFNASQTIEVAAKLAQYAPKAEAEDMLTTNAEGKVKFEGLTPGMYLVMQTGKTGEAAKYTDYEPAVFNVPQLTNTANGKEWNYHLSLAPKTEVEKETTPPPPPPDEPPGLPKTNDSNHPYLWIGTTCVSFAALLLVVVLFIKARRQEA